MPKPTSPASHVGMGRELFGVFRGAVGSADEGAAIFPAALTLRKRSGVEAFFIIGERNGPLVSRPERALMSSRLWLAVAFVLAAGASPARAETSADRGHARPGQDRPAASGHGDAHRRQPDDRGRDHAQEQQYDGHHRQGLRADEPDRDRRRRDRSSRSSRSGSCRRKPCWSCRTEHSRISYACNPACMPTVQLGDDDKTFKDVGEQISTRNGYAAGGRREIRRAPSAGRSPLKRA